MGSGAHFILTWWIWWNIFQTFGRHFPSSTPFQNFQNRTGFFFWTCYKTKPMNTAQYKWKKKIIKLLISQWTLKWQVERRYYAISLHIFIHFMRQSTEENKISSLKNISACVCMLSCIEIFAAPRTVAHQAPLHRIFQARILDWVAISSFRDFPDPRIKPSPPVSPGLAGGFFTTEPLNDFPGQEILVSINDTEKGWT